MTVGDVYKASALFSAENADGEMVVTFHYETTVQGGAGNEFLDALDLGIALRDGIDANYVPLLANTVTFEQVDVIGITNPLISFTAPSGQDGLLNEGTVSLRSAPLIALKTGFRGRSYNGRQFWIAPTESQQQNGELDPAFQDAMQLMYQAIRVLTGTTQGSDFTSGVYSKTLSAVQGQPVINTISNWIVRPQLATQKGRQSTIG